MSTRTVALSSKELDSAIEVLSSARHALQLTRFERLSYQALILSVDWIAVWVFALAGLGVVKISAETSQWLNLVFVSLLVVGLFVGLLSLALNVPLCRKVFRERARLKELGLSFLSRSLWKESRRSGWNRWINLIHGTLLSVAGIILLIAIWAIFYLTDDKAVLAFAIFIYVVGASLIFAARYLKNQRERMDLTANAEELRKAFQNLRQRAGESKLVTVPSQLLEQTAQIESAQIANERKDAILESVSSRPSGYTIAFDRDAAEQRATLDVADRIELADLVAQLSIAGMKLERPEGKQPKKTKGNRVEIDYAIDNASRSIRVITVRRLREVDASVSGASHA